MAFLRPDLALPVLLCRGHASGFWLGGLAREPGDPLTGFPSGYLVAGVIQSDIIAILVCVVEILDVGNGAWAIALGIGHIDPISNPEVLYVVSDLVGLCRFRSRSRLFSLVFAELFASDPLAGSEIAFSLRYLEPNDAALHIGATGNDAIDPFLPFGSWNGAVIACFVALVPCHALPV